MIKSGYVIKQNKYYRHLLPTRHYRYMLCLNDECLKESDDIVDLYNHFWKISDEEVMCWEEEAEPVYVKELDLTIIGDRHLPNGRRQHLVKEASGSFTEWNNADIIYSEDAILGDEE